VIIIYSLDAPKSILETEKTLKTLSSGQIYQTKTEKKQKKTKKPKNQKYPLGGFSCKKKRVFVQPCLVPPRRGSELNQNGLLSIQV
jgi:hypothetical protein